MDYEERITAAELGDGEERSEMTLRPQTLEDYIGQKKATENLKIFIEAAKLRGGTAGSRAVLRSSGTGQDNAGGDNRQ